MPLTEGSFETLLEAARTGAEWAWADLYRGLHGQLTGYLASRGAHEPEDLASEVFLQVARHIHDFEGDLSGFRSWVFVIAHRRLLDERRRIARRPHTVRIEMVPSAHLDDVGGDVEDEAIDRVSTAEMERIFSMLTAGQRDVLALRVIAGLTLAETARVVEKSLGAVKAIQRRALEAVQAMIDAEEVSI